MYPIGPGPNSAQDYHQLLKTKILKLTKDALFAAKICSNLKIDKSIVNHIFRACFPQFYILVKMFLSLEGYFIQQLLAKFVQ